MKWFRFYSEVLHDSKVQTLSADMFRAWVNILCVANEGEKRGSLPDMKQIAFALRVKEEKAAQIVGHLEGCGLIDRDEDGTLRPHNWDKRQRNSDDVSNRVREHRRRKADVSSSGNVTLHVTGSKHNETRSNCRVRPDSDTETDSEQNTPPNPQRGEVWVSLNGSDPVPIQDAPLQAVPQIDEAELARVGQRAERLFPMADFGPKIRGIAGDFPLATIDAALTELHTSGKRTWQYLIGIARRIDAQGGPSKAVPGSPAAVPAESVESPEQKAARLASATERMKAHRAQLAQEGRRASR